MCFPSHRPYFILDTWVTLSPFAGKSRKASYKLHNRYKDCGIDGVTDLSRRPYVQANQSPIQIEKLIVNLKKAYSHWGAPKIREKR